MTEVSENERIIADLKECGAKVIYGVTGKKADAFDVLRKIVANRGVHNRFVNTFLNELTDEEFLSVMQSFRGLKLVEDVLFSEELDKIAKYDNDNVCSLLREAVE